VNSSGRTPLKAYGADASGIVDVRIRLDDEGRLPVSCEGLLSARNTWTLYNHRLEHAIAVYYNVPFCWVETDLAAMLKEIARHE